MTIAALIWTDRLDQGRPRVGGGNFSIDAFPAPGRWRECFTHGFRLVCCVIGLWIPLAVLAVATVLGLVLRARSGRIRTSTATEVPAEVLSLLPKDARVTLLQLSTTFCAPCAQARALLSALAERTDGLRHVNLDITDRPELARQLRVLRTPTTLALDKRGRELLRIGGVPRNAQLTKALHPHL